MEKELGLVGKKIGMTQVFDEDGNIVPVTVIELAENIITDIKTKDKHGYNAIQIGNFEIKKETRLNKPRRGYFKKKDLPLLKELQEFRLGSEFEAAQLQTENLKIGSKINAEEFFKDLKKVTVSGKSIGKGFQSGIKLYNMRVGRRSHGSKSKRIIGSLGAGTDPGRVFPGKRMPAMMGNRKSTIAKAKVFKYDLEKNVVLIRGPVAGKIGSVVTIKAFGVKKWNHKNKIKLSQSCAL